MALGTVNGCVVNFIPVNGRLEAEEEGFQGAGILFPARKPKPKREHKIVQMPRQPTPEEVFAEVGIEAEPIEDEFVLLQMLFGRHGRFK